MHTSSANFSTRSTRLRSITAAFAFGLLWSPAGIVASSADAARWQPSLRHAAVVAQDSDSTDRAGVSPDQLEKYVAVYGAMQRDRGLTVESAAAKESLTLNQFRELEQKIERNDLAREQVRRELQAAANLSPSARSTAIPAKH